MDLPASLQALAATFDVAKPFDANVADDDAAVRVLAAVLHGGGCPVCGGVDWRPQGNRWIFCEGCVAALPVYRRSALGGRKIPARILLAALYAVFTGDRTTSAHAFSRTFDFHLQTGWRLLHTVRDALPMGASACRGSRAQVTGFVAEANAAVAVIGVDHAGNIVATVADVSDGDGGDGDSDGDGRRDREAVNDDAEETPPETALLLGRSRAWICTSFRWVSKQHLGRYLREFAARVGRVARHQLEMQRAAVSSRRKRADRCRNGMAA